MKRDIFSLEDIAYRAAVDYGFTPYFDQAVLKHINRLKSATPHKKDRIKDLRELYWSSIDNVDSEDLDQLEYCERHPHGHVHVKIAIADVDHYVTCGKAIDRHASHNATSLYTGVHNFPMLPEDLSYHLSSLLPDEDRLAIVIEYNVQKNGLVSYGDVYRAWVRNKAKLIYEQVGQWLDKPQEHHPHWLNDDLKKQLLLQYEASQKLRLHRQQEGMLEFETIETKAVIVEGKLKGMIEVESTCAHKIIEQFMVSANQTMVHFLNKHEMPTIQRIVRNPERWARIVEIAAELHFDLPLEPDALALRRFLVQRHKASPDTFADLSLAIIKLIGRGEYEMVLPGRQGHGHFGLSIGNYTHSTAPNRRYVDLIIQRLVKAALAKEPCPYTKRELIEHAGWCSDRDAAAKKVERFMRKVAAAILLKPREGETLKDSAPRGPH